MASIPVGGLLNPLTHLPTIAPLAMLVDHIGSLANHYRRNEDEWTVRALRTGRSSGVAGAQAIGDDGKVALLARLTAYR